MGELIDIIDKGFEHGGRLEDPTEQEELADAVEQAITLLDTGKSRVAEKVGDDWQVNSTRTPSLSSLDDETFIVGGGFSGEAEIDGPDDSVITLFAENERDGFLVRVCP